LATKCQSQYNHEILNLVVSEALIGPDTTCFKRLACKPQIWLKELNISHKAHHKECDDKILAVRSINTLKRQVSSDAFTNRLLIYPLLLGRHFIESFESVVMLYFLLFCYLLTQSCFHILASTYYFLFVGFLFCHS
jgi:hypothetical protein